ncbi:unnamed protein product [Cutaneotrichosporon oleaginosum]
MPSIGRNKGAAFRVRIRMAERETVERDAPWSALRTAVAIGRDPCLVRVCFWEAIERLSLTKPASIPGVIVLHRLRWKVAGGHRLLVSYSPLAVGMAIFTHSRGVLDRSAQRGLTTSEDFTTPKLPAALLVLLSASSPIGDVCLKAILSAGVRFQESIPQRARLGGATPPRLGVLLSELTINHITATQLTLLSLLPVTQLKVCVAYHCDLWTSHPAEVLAGLRAAALASEPHSTSSTTGVVCYSSEAILETKLCN